MTMYYVARVLFYGWIDGCDVIIMVLANLATVPFVDGSEPDG